MPRRRVRVGLIESVKETRALYRSLHDAVDGAWLANAGRFQNCRPDVNDVRELMAQSTRILDDGRPGYDDALCGAAEERRDHLVPSERRVDRPRPRCGKVRRGTRTTPVIVEVEQLFDRRVDAVHRGKLVGGAVWAAFSACA